MIFFILTLGILSASCLGESSAGSRSVLWTDDWDLARTVEIFEKRKKTGLPMSFEEKKFQHQLDIKQWKEKQKQIKIEDDMREKEKQPRRERQVVCFAGIECVTVGTKIWLTREKGIVYCYNCASPRKFGTMLPKNYIWNSFWNSDEYDIEGILEYAVPNDASSYIRNAVDIRDHIALVHRGKVPLVQKVKHCQDAGAKAVIIIDSDTVVDKYKSEVNEGNDFWFSNIGFASNDSPLQWREISIPAIILHEKAANILKDTMKIERMYIREFGTHLMNIHSDD
eukprot:g2134.t1